jgi:hypothetical protein
MLAVRTSMRVRQWPLLVPPALFAFLSWGPATQGPTTCPFAIATGQACPLCGGTRAASALLEGDLVLAWQMHPIIFVVAPLLVLGFVRWLRVRAGKVAPLSSRTTNLAVAALGVAFLAVWLVRGLTGTLPPV